MKTLNEAIGCWTVNAAYNSLPVLTRMCSDTANACKRITLSKRNDPRELEQELIVLKKRLQTTLEVAESAIARVNKIIELNEVIRT